MNYGDHRTNAALSMLFSAVAMNPEQTRQLIDETWSSIVPTLQQYISIPNQSPLYDPDWRRNGYMHQAGALAKAWVEQQGIQGLTTSLRGSIVGNLHVEVLTEGVHSGDASGIVPSTFRVIRMLLDRLEDASSGEIIPEWLHVDVPHDRLEELKATARVLGDDVWSKFPFAPGVQPVSKDPLQLLVNRTWRPALAYTGQAGFPDLQQGGNVLRPKTAIKLSLRVPPSLDAGDIDRKLKNLLESDPPYGARVLFDPEKGGGGWVAPKIAPWLEQSVERASKTYFGKGPMTFGEGGSIPFMGMLGARYPEAQFLITGVLGPHSNAHGPNEFLHIPYARALTACVAQVLSDERTTA